MPPLPHNLSNLGESNHHTDEYRFLCQDRIYLWPRENKIVERSEGSTPRSIGSLSNITEKKLAEAEVLKALAKEKEVLELKLPLVSMTSYEFRTPLTVIKSSAQLLEPNECSQEEELKQLQLRFLSNR